MNNSETFCILPWIHIATRTDGKIVPCCLNPEIVKNHDGQEMNFTDQNLISTWNSSTIRNLRHDLRTGKRSQSCSVCYSDEANGKESYRLRANREWAKKVSFQKKELTASKTVGTLTFSPAYLDLRLGSSCNLQCRMCYPENSTSLAKSYKEISTDRPDFPVPQITQSNETETQKNNWYDTFEFNSNMIELTPNLKEIYLPGGEPMMLKKVPLLLKGIIESGQAQNIDLKFHTNTTVWNSEVIDLLPKFKKVRISCSIDGYGSVDDYIRYPTRFDVVEKTFMKYLSFSEMHNNIEIYVSCAVSILNVFELSKLLVWYNRTYNLSSKKPVNLIFNIVHSPEFLSLGMLPLRFKKLALNEINHSISLIQVTNLKALWIFDSLISISNLLQKTSTEPPDSAVQRFLKFTSILDEKRNLDVKKMNPALYELIRYYETRDESVLQSANDSKKTQVKKIFLYSMWFIWKKVLDRFFLIYGQRIKYPMS